MHPVTRFAIVLFFLLNVFQGAQQAGVTGGNEMSYSEFMAGARDGRVGAVRRGIAGGLDMTPSSSTSAQWGQVAAWTLARRRAASSFSSGLARIAKTSSQTLVAAMATRSAGDLLVLLTG